MMTVVLVVESEASGLLLSGKKVFRWMADAVAKVRGVDKTFVAAVPQHRSLAHTLATGMDGVADIGDSTEPAWSPGRLRLLPEFRYFDLLLVVRASFPLLTTRRLEECAYVAGQAGISQSANMTQRAEWLRSGAVCLPAVALPVCCAHKRDAGFLQPKSIPLVCPEYLDASRPDEFGVLKTLAET